MIAALLDAVVEIVPVLALAAVAFVTYMVWRTTR